MSRVTFVSFRLGGSDGVAVAARAWIRAFERLGWRTRTVAGSGPVDHRVRGLELGATAAPDPCAVTAAVADADLVVVANLLTIPLNLPASRVVATALAGRPAILHHHDPAWQRDHLAHVTELPPDDPAWAHVTVNALTRRELAERGIDATVVRNGFDVDTAPGDRDGTRARLGLAPTDRLALHPVRAIERKNVPAALGICEHLGATYWLLGNAEDGYGPTLDSLLSTARCPVVRGDHGVGVDDAYAACDLVVFPSRWEGFGNPPVEAALRRRPVVVGDYPVASELLAYGFGWFGPDDLHAVAAALTAPDPARLDRDRDIARRWFSVDAVTVALAALLEERGWTGDR